MRNICERLALGAAATALCAVTGGGVATAAAPNAPAAPVAAAASEAPAASAAAKCPYPYVCFTKGSTVLSKYKDTGRWQKLGPKGRTADSAHNTRKDDVVYVTFSNAAKICMKPGEGWGFGGAKPREVFISTSSKCKGAGARSDGTPAKAEGGAGAPAPLRSGTR